MNTKQNTNQYKYLKWAFFCLLLCGLFTQPSYAQKDDSDENLQLLDQERYQVEQDIKNIDKMLKSVAGKQKSSLQELTLIKKKIDTRKIVLSTIDKQINTLQSQLVNKQEAIEILQAELQTVQASFAILLTRYYSYSNKTTWLMYIMASESVSQAYRRVKYLRDILLLIEVKAEQITNMTNQLNAEIVEMSGKRKKLNTNLDDKQREVKTLIVEEIESKNVLSSLKKEEGQLKNRLDTRKKEFEKLDQEMRKLLREELDKNPIEEISNADLATSKNFQEAKGFMPWPVVGIITAEFGTDNVHPVYKNVKMPPNKGIDILTQENAPVTAVFPGKISKIFPIPGMGLCMLIQHGPYYTLYARLGSTEVKLGEDVNARQVIGKVAPSADGSVLHFELWRRTEVQNPQKWLVQ